MYIKKLNDMVRVQYQLNQRFWIQIHLWKYNGLKSLEVKFCHTLSSYLLYSKN